RSTQRSRRARERGALNVFSQRARVVAMSSGPSPGTESIPSPGLGDDPALVRTGSGRNSERRHRGVPVAAEYRLVYPPAAAPPCVRVRFSARPGDLQGQSLEEAEWSTAQADDGGSRCSPAGDRADGRANFS